MIQYAGESGNKNHNRKDFESYRRPYLRIGGKFTEEKFRALITEVYQTPKYVLHCIENGMTGSRFEDKDSDKEL